MYSIYTLKPLYLSETIGFEFEFEFASQITVGMQVYDVLGYAMDPVNPMIVEIEFCRIIGCEMANVGYFVDLHECEMLNVHELELYFELQFKFENVNVKCKVDNGYDNPPSSPAALHAPTNDFNNTAIGILGNNILECGLDGNVNKNVYDNEFDCGVLSPPIRTPPRAAIDIIFNGTGLEIPANIVLKGIFGIDLCKYGFVNEVNKEECRIDMICNSIARLLLAPKIDTIVETEDQEGCTIINTTCY